MTDWDDALAAVAELDLMPTCRMNAVEVLTRAKMVGCVPPDELKTVTAGDTLYARWNGKNPDLRCDLIVRADRAWIGVTYTPKEYCPGRAEFAPRAAADEIVRILQVIGRMPR